MKGLKNTIRCKLGASVIAALSVTSTWLLRVWVAFASLRCDKPAL